MQHTRKTAWLATAALLMGLGAGLTGGQLAWAQQPPGVSSPPALAGGPTPLADAQRQKQLAMQIVNLVLDESNFEKVMSEAVNIGFAGVAEELKRSRGLTDAELQPYRDAFRRAFLGTYPKQDWLDDMAAVYSRIFSVDELTEMLRWYETPTGRKVLQRMPEVMQGSGQAGQRVVQRRMSEFQSALRRELKLIDGN